MWESLRRVVAHLLRRAQQSASDRKIIAERQRFWAEVREGENEAESRSVS